MQISDFPFSTSNWSEIERVEHKGATGFAYWRTQTFGSVRVRLVEYSAGYLADQWCSKGHILFCLDGQLHAELEDGRKFELAAGSSLQVADDKEKHRFSSPAGTMLFIVD